MGVEALVKDTAFEALIIGAADGLDKRAQERRRLAKKMEDPKVGAALASEEGETPRSSRNWRSTSSATPSTKRTSPRGYGP